MIVTVDVRRRPGITTWREVYHTTVLQARRWAVGHIEDVLAQRLWGSP